MTVPRTGPVCYLAADGQGNFQRHGICIGQHEPGNPTVPAPYYFGILNYDNFSDVYGAPEGATGTATARYRVYGPGEVLLSETFHEFAPSSIFSRPQVIYHRERAMSVTVGSVEMWAIGAEYVWAPEEPEPEESLGIDEDAPLTTHVRFWGR